jgi:filamentous hemagglutinin
LESWSDVVIVAPVVIEFGAGSKALVNELLATRNAVREAPALFRGAPATTDVMGSEMLDDSLRLVEQPFAGRRLPQIRINKAAGDAWEAEVVNERLPLTQTDIRPQISIRSLGPSQKTVRLDAVGTDEANVVRLTDAKASMTAPLQPNQKVVYPELPEYGGVVVGKGKPPYTGGTTIPPVVVDVIRKPK